MLDALWVVILGMVITFAAMLVLLGVMILINKLTTVPQKKEVKG